MRPEELDDLSGTQVLDERARLVGIGYRLLGSRADAEDAVQDTYARWLRLSAAERSAIRSPAAWLTTAMSRVCLTMLSSARHRRETYVGEWLPEPAAAGSELRAVGFGSAPIDPADRVVLDDRVTTALMVVLEALTPGERVAFILHDVFAVPFGEIAGIVGRSPEACRQLATSARRRVEGPREAAPISREHRAVVEAFWEACRVGDLPALIGTLAPDATLISDGGGLAKAALRPVQGADRVARFLVGILRKNPRIAPELSMVEGEAQLVLRLDDVVVGVGGFAVAGGVVTGIWLVRNPLKLQTWNPDVPGNG